MSKTSYLGDGLYATHDGFQYYLRTLREGNSEVHWVALDPDVLEAFLRFIEQIENVDITVIRKEGQNEQN